MWVRLFTPAVVARNYLCYFFIKLLSIYPLEEKKRKKEKEKTVRIIVFRPRFVYGLPLSEEMGRETGENLIYF